jgi:hypothetical protein
MLLKMQEIYMPFLLIDQSPKKMYLPRELLISMEHHFDMHDPRLSLMHLNSCLPRVEEFSNLDLSRVLRVAMATSESDIQAYLIHLVNERMTVRGEEFATTDDEILIFFNELL